jgi:NDP-sugar pyrophosphorylase family protein
MSSLTSFFLCAGFGSRLRPFTNRVPKPAIPFLGQSALEINVRAVDTALSPDYRLANAHHLPDAIRAIAAPLSVDVLLEPEILGTGGCLAHAGARLAQTDHFLVHNADLLHNIDLAALYRAHVESGALATLAGLYREGAVNTLSVEERKNGRGGQLGLLGVHGFDGFTGDTHESKRLTFAGIAFYRRDFLAFVPSGESDIKPWWKAAQAGGGLIRVVDVTGATWHDFGTPQGLWEATKYRMESTGVYAHKYAAAPDEQGRPPRVSNEAGLTDLPDALRNVVVYEAPRIPLDEGTTNLLTGYDFDWKVRP